MAKLFTVHPHRGDDGKYYDAGSHREVPDAMVQFYLMPDGNIQYYMLMSMGEAPKAEAKVVEEVKPVEPEAAVEETKAEAPAEETKAVEKPKSKKK